MNTFLNYKNGVASINTYRFVDAKVTDVNDIVLSNCNNSDEILTASLDLFIKEELSKIDLSNCCDIDAAKDYIFGEADFLELTLSELNIDISEYPDLRDYQHDFINEYFC